MLMMSQDLSCGFGYLSVHLRSYGSLLKGSWFVISAGEPGLFVSLLVLLQLGKYLEFKRNFLLTLTLWLPI